MVAEYLSDIPTWLQLSIVPLVAAAVALAAHAVLYRVAAKLATRTHGIVDDSLVARSRRPMRAVFVIVAVLGTIPSFEWAEFSGEGIRQTLSIVLTLAVGWLGISLTGTINDYVDHVYRLDVADNLRARQAHTQVVVIRRVAIAVIAIVTLCLVLMSVPQARQIGISLFASAGVAGLIIGMAARPALSNLIAGLQIALTGPVHIDDVVIIEGEWGRIEEITTTYVVVRIWDERRLVVPLSHFIERPFQNWTRRTADILGTIFVYADYTLPVDRVREKLREIVESSDLWDKRVCGLQVTNATERTMELRALVSAADASKAWDLRCLVREQLIAWLQQEYPDSLPRVRAELEGEMPDDDPPSAN